MVLNQIVVPKCDKYGNATYEEALHSSNVWYPVESRVAWSCNDFLSEVHLNGKVDLDIKTLLIGFSWLQGENENPIILQLGQIIKVCDLILQVKLCGLNFEWNCLSHLGIDRLPIYSTLLNNRIFAILLWVKSNLIVEYKDELISKVLNDLLFAFAVFLTSALD